MITTVYEVNLDKIIKSIDAIKKRLMEEGAVKIKNLFSEIDGIALADALGSIVQNTDANEDGVVRIAPLDQLLSRKNHIGFTKAGLFPHTDRSPSERPPNLIFLWCKKPETQRGGVSILVDCKKLIDDFSKNDLKHFNNLMIPGTVVFDDGESCYKGAIFEKYSDQYMTVRFRYDNCVFFNANILDSVSCFMKYIDKHKIFIKLNRGEGFIIQNNRWLHGRTSFNEDRLICRIHINSEKDKCEIPPGFRSPI